MNMENHKHTMMTLKKIMHMIAIMVTEGKMRMNNKYNDDDDDDVVVDDDDDDCDFDDDH